ncbi:phage major capsid protein [Thalassospira sp. MCCC 1A01428]|uniref:phage major capsid protein n=1 Tax=Thalassospira sp. MCCC 1A01428 TaxID=1470575 RepID=UPI000A1F09EF|nr:phage major capsid protein [Thalassospira sp. MCCC 1A01428]OSQ35032.1 capsid protein [Thalassospira sp. MCCC 1A01428]
MTLKEMQARRAKMVADMDKLVSGDALTDEQRSQFDDLEKQIGTLDSDIKRMETIEARRSEAAAQVPAGGGSNDDPAAGGTRSQDPFGGRPGLVPAQFAEQRDLGDDFGAFVRCYGASQLELRDGRSSNPAQVAAKLYGEGHPVVDDLTRAQTMSDNAAGGFTVTPNYMPEIIKLMGPKTIVRQRATVVPGNATYIKGKDAAVVSYVGENEQGNTTKVTFGTMTMAEKDISAILPISKKLLRTTSYGVEAYCRNELIRAAARFEDRKFLYGTGTGKEVKGYKGSILAVNKIDAADLTAPTNKQVRADLRKLMKPIIAADIELGGENTAWFMNPLVKMYLEDLYEGDNLAFPTLQGNNPTLLGYPVDTTTTIAGASGDGGDIFFGAHGYAQVADSVALSLSTSDQASFVDATGATVNMWAMGMLGIKLDMSHDFAFRYEQAFSMLQKVKWGQ